MSRVGASILRCVGLEEFAAATADEYIATVVALAQDKDRREALRAGIRSRLMASPLLDRYANGPDSLFGTLMLARTGERLTRASFLANRKPGETVILFVNTPQMEAMAITSPLTAIASDGGLRKGIGHPRAAGTFARVLGHYVRETHQLTLIDAIGKMTLMPAQRLELVAGCWRNQSHVD